MRSGTPDTDCVVCVDVGSTFTKAALVDLGSGALLGDGVAPDHASTPT